MTTSQDSGYTVDGVDPFTRMLIRGLDVEKVVSAQPSEFSPIYTRSTAGDFDRDLVVGEIATHQATHIVATCVLPHEWEVPRGPWHVAIDTETLAVSMNRADIRAKPNDAGIPMVRCAPSDATAKLGGQARFIQRDPWKYGYFEAGRLWRNATLGERAKALGLSETLSAVGIFDPNLLRLADALARTGELALLSSSCTDYRLLLQLEDTFSSSLDGFLGDRGRLYVYCSFHDLSSSSTSVDAFCVIEGY